MCFVEFESDERMYEYRYTNNVQCIYIIISQVTDVLNFYKQSVIKVVIATQAREGFDVMCE